MSNTTLDPPAVIVDSFIDRHLGWLQKTRTILVIIGLGSGWLAVATRNGYTTDEMRLRDASVVFLFASFIIGVGSLRVPPNRYTMGVMGLLMMVNAVIRFFGFGIPVWEEQTDPDAWLGRRIWQFIENATVVPVWGLLGFLGGLVLFLRRNDPSLTGARNDR